MDVPVFVVMCYTRCCNLCLYATAKALQKHCKSHTHPISDALPFQIPIRERKKRGSSLEAPQIFELHTVNSNRDEIIRFEGDVDVGCEHGERGNQTTDFTPHIPKPKPKSKSKTWRVIFLFCSSDEEIDERKTLKSSWSWAEAWRREVGRESTKNKTKNTQSLSLRWKWSLLLWALALYLTNNNNKYQKGLATQAILKTLKQMAG